MTYRYSGLTKEGNHKSGIVVALSEVDALLKIRESHGIRLVTSLTEGPQNKFIQEILNLKDIQEAKIRNLFMESNKRQAQKTETTQISLEEFFEKTFERAKEQTKAGIIKFLKIDFSTFLRKKEKEPVVKKEENKEILSIFNSIAFEELKREKEENGNKSAFPQPSTLTEGKAINWELIDKSQKINAKRNKKREKIRVNKKDILLFTKRLQIMLSSGVTLVNSLKVLANGSTRRGLSSLIARLVESLESGNTLSESLALFPKQFDPLYISLVAIGEDSGTMHSVLLDIVTAKEREYKLSRKINSAMIYPAIMGFVLVGILVLGSLYFIPAFEEMFSGQEMELPLLTAVVFAIANKIPFIAGGAFLAAFPIMIASKKIPAVHKRVKRVTDKLALSIPVIKNVKLLSHMHNFTFTISMMLKNGIKLRDSLGMASKTINNVHINEEIAMVSRMMTEGLTMSEALSQQKYFDEIVTNIALTGEESGNMSFALGEAGTYYKNELEKAIETAIEFIEPASIILMAAIIVPVILAVYLPILEISSGGTLGI